jgi:hypothetical protein
MALVRKEADEKRITVFESFRENKINELLVTN